MGDINAFSIVGIGLSGISQMIENQVTREGFAVDKVRGLPPWFLLVGSVVIDESIGGCEEDHSEHS